MDNVYTHLFEEIVVDSGNEEIDVSSGSNGKIEIVEGPVVVSVRGNNKGKERMLYQKTLKHRCEELEQMNKMLMAKIKMMEDEIPNAEHTRSIYQEKECLLVIWQDYTEELKMQ